MTVGSLDHICALAARRAGVIEHDAITSFLTLVDTMLIAVMVQVSKFVRFQDGEARITVLCRGELKG